jgi:hypothetical protein
MQTKKCGGPCGQWLPLSEFHRRGNGYQSVCKICRAQLDRERYQQDDTKKLGNQRYRQQVTEFVRQYKARSGCACCGLNNPTVLDFHHIHGKDFDIAQKMWSLPKVKREIAKCVVVCANCHRLIHAGELSL